MSNFKASRYLVILLLSIQTVTLSAQSIENEFQLRSSIGFDKRLNNRLKIYVAPEIRWTSGEGFDKYNLISGVKYKALDFLSVEAEYRLIGDRIEGESNDYVNRFGFSMEVKEKMKRWEPGSRIKYTNYIDGDGDGNFLRYKTFLTYDIPNFKLNPELGFELFHDLGEGNIYKYRSSLGVDYKLSKKVKLSSAYKFDYYMTKNKNRHIWDVGLKIKL